MDMYEREQLWSQPIRVYSATPKTAGFFLTSDSCKYDSKTCLVETQRLFFIYFFFHSDFRKILQIYFTPNFCFLFSLSKSAHKGMRNSLRGRRHRSDGRKKKKMYKQQTYSVPLSTIWVSREMPSRLMNSWAKVMSREALARSFRASSLASMLDDWIRSWSVTAVWYWNGQMEVGGHALKVAWHTYCLYRMGLVYLRT